MDFQFFYELANQLKAGIKTDTRILPILMLKLTNLLLKYYDTFSVIKKFFAVVLLKRSYVHLFDILFLHSLLYQFKKKNLRRNMELRNNIGNRNVTVFILSLMNGN